MEGSHPAKCNRLGDGLKSATLAQSSMEYLLVVALTFVIIVPTTYIFYNFSKESTVEISDAQLVKLGRGIIDTAESIYYSGEGSKTVMEVTVPDNVVTGSIIDGKELVFNLTSSFGISEIVFFSAVNLTTTPSNCDLNVCKLPDLASPGLKKIKIEAIGKESVKIETI